jgi:NADPH:quinone reductase-like Zn-dependent oxidoreductase
LCKLIIGVARDAGFRPIAVVRRDDQIPVLEKLGAAHVVNADRPGFSRQMGELCKAELPRVLLDAVTGPQASAIFHVMGRGARWIIYGRLDSSDTTLREPGQLIFMSKRVEGFWLVDWMRRVPPERKAAVVAEAQQRFADGRWKTDVTAVVPLKEAMRRVPGELAKPNGKVFIAP